ncbi:MutS-related protein [Crenalkalicoccus roseus]|uniref:MutS-related protein n=1 Tax=Crenalkalicoccus roseus TaxID=1485588 RepID=UPI001F0209D7|nr:DNA mismatch repair protein MutS [Crenalkalicoccus roseus]
MLFRSAENCARAERAEAPDCLRDLNLDQVIAAVTAGREEYDLARFFHLPLHDVDEVVFRHEVMRDLETLVLLDGIRTLASSMRTTREDLALSGKMRDARQRDRWFLAAAEAYCDGVAGLDAALSAGAPASRGLKAFGVHLRRYVASHAFAELRRAAGMLTADLAAIRYKLRIEGSRVDVFRHAGEGDYGAEVQADFAPFRQGAGRRFDFTHADRPEMNHVEELILDQVVKLFPAPFEALAAFRERHAAFPEATLAAFDREVQFYLCWLKHIRRLGERGLRFCYPEVSRTSKAAASRDGFDLALAGVLAQEGRAAVCNDFALSGAERVIVVSGPNQGGKTTFARSFGQLHYLAALGLPVPGSEARLFLPDRIFTHFERGEDTANLRGRLQDDLVRARDILAAATPDSLIVMNEIFSATSFRDAALLSRRLAARILALDLLCVWVTFVDELASLGPQTVSMVSTVVPERPAERTFRVVRRPADGRAHALAIAEKYRLTRDAILERIAS